MNNKIIVIIGTTASGKTKLGIELANDINGEIINLDAFQIYKEIKIGTARPDSNELSMAKFHMDGVISIYDEWNIKKMQDTVEKEINLILSNNKTPIIVGGSLLYIDCLIRNYKLLSVGRTADYSNLSNEEIYNQLFKLDPIQAEKIGINNRKRIERAYELISTGNKMYETSPSPYNFLVIKIEKDKEEINNLINKRVNQMFEDGWIDEVKQIYIKDNNIENLNALKAIGYPQIISSIKNNTKIDIDEIKTKTRQYAKKQRTWMNHHVYDNTLIYKNNYQEVLDKTKQFIDETNS